jgi:polyisoprenoid-binding protein YceI
LTVAPISSAAPLPESGSGDGVFQVDAAAGTWTITSEHDSGNFSVDQIIPGVGLLGVDGGNLVFENNPYSGRVPVKAGLSLIHVSADGANWTITQG